MTAKVLSTERHVRRPGPAPDPSVAARLDVTVSARGEKKPRKSIGNAMTILACDASWRNVLAYDAFAEHPILRAQPPQREQDSVAVQPGAAWSPQDSTRAAAWMFAAYGLDVPPGVVTDAMLAISQRRQEHPVRAYLEALVWDGRPRLDAFFPVYCGTRDGAYARGVARMILLSAVARVMRPGSKVDTIAILEGRQGALKSTLLRALAGDAWFADSPIPLGDKDAFQVLRGVWIYEIAELAAFRGRDATRIKSFASSQTDHYRPSYEPRARSVPRQCIFVGTTNEAHYLADATGARRFWPVSVVHADVEAVRRDRDQLWAEAVARFSTGEPWWPDHSLDSLGADAQEERFEGDPWEEPILRWLERPTLWLLVAGETRREESRLDPTAGLTMSEVLLGAVGLPIERHDKVAQGRAAAVLRRAGWQRGPMRREGGERVRRWSLITPSPGANEGEAVTAPVTWGGDK